MNKIYCLQCKKYAGNKNITVLQASNGRTMISAHCIVFNSNAKQILKKKNQRTLVAYFIYF